MRQVMAFVDALCFLPSIPATAVTSIHNIGYNNSLVEMAQQSQFLVRNLAREHLRLVHQIECLGLTQEISPDAIDTVLKAVANGEEASIPAPQIPMARRAAAAAGAPGKSAKDASAPTARQVTPIVVAAAVEEPSKVLPARSQAQPAVLVPLLLPSHMVPQKLSTYPLTAFT